MTDSAQLRNAIRLLKTLREPNPIGGFPRGREREIFRSLVAGLNATLPCQATVSSAGSDIDFAHANYSTIFALRKGLLIKRLANGLMATLTVKPKLSGCTGVRGTCIRWRDQRGGYCNPCLKI
jgi:hypothetical protein